MDTPPARRFLRLTAGQWITGAVLAAGLLWRLAIWRIQPGAYLDDEIGHFIIARDAWKHPELIFSWWGRIGCTLFYMPGALFGWEGTRAISLVTSQLVVLLTYAVARRLDLKYPILAVLFLELQPWFTSSSHELLTVVPAMFFMVLAVWLELRGQSALAALAVGYLPLIRHEFISLVGLWGLYCICRWRFIPLLTTAVPIVMYNLTAKLYLGVWPFRHYLRPSGTTFYGSGELDHFIRLISGNEFVGLPILALTAAGLHWMLQDRRRMLLLFWAGAYLCAHTLIYWMGAFASGGFAIFILPLAPFIAIAASAGFLAIATKSGLHPTGLIDQIGRYLVAGVLLSSSLLVGFGALKPRPYNGDAIQMRQASDFLHKHNLASSEIASTNVWLYYWLPLTTPHKLGRWGNTLWIANRLNELEAGDIIVWDRHYSDRYGHKLELLRASEDWEMLHLEAYKEKPLWAVFRKNENLQAEG